MKTVDSDTGKTKTVVTKKRIRKKKVVKINCGGSTASEKPERICKHGKRSDSDKCDSSGDGRSVGSTESEGCEDSFEGCPTDEGGGGDGNGIPHCKFITHWYDDRITYRQHFF